MTKRPRTLTAAFVRTISRPGVYGDGRGGRGLSLRVHRTLDGRITKTWRQRVRIEGRLTSIGLGPYPEVTLAEARQKALDNSRGVRLGQDPRGRGVPTFAEAAEKTIELHRGAWKAGSPLPEQWESTFRLHAAPLLDKPVDRIESADVLRCLAPIWNAKPAAARKARHRIAAVFRWCMGRNYRPDNPVDRAVEALPKVNGNTTSHHRALPHGEVAAALRAVRRTTDTHPSAVLCVELIVLTAVRPGGSSRRGARRTLGGDRHGRGSVDDPGFSDEGGPRVRRTAQHGRARRARTGTQAVGQVSAGVPLANRRAASVEGLAQGAPARRRRLDATRVPVECAVVDGRVGSSGGGRGGLPRPRSQEPGRSGVSALRPADTPCRSLAGME